MISRTVRAFSCGSCGGCSCIVVVVVVEVVAAAVVVVVVVATTVVALSSSKHETDALTTAVYSYTTHQCYPCVNTKREAREVKILMYCSHAKPLKLSYDTDEIGRKDAVLPALLHDNVC